MTNNKSLQHIIQAVGHELSTRTEEVWTLNPDIANAEIRQSLRGPSDKTIYFTAPPYQKEARIEIYGGYPRGPQGEWMLYRAKVPKITVAKNRAPEQIAADIQRRFLPRYEQAFNRAQDEKKRLEEKLRRQAEIIAGLVSVLGYDRSHIRQYRDRVSFTGKTTGSDGEETHRIMGTAQIMFEDKIKLELRYVTPSLAQAIIGMVT